MSYAVLLEVLCLVTIGSNVQAAPQPIDCRLVFCAEPTCELPTPPNTAVGECCSHCPDSEFVKCPVEGQVFTECGSACPANCTDPTPICTKPCVARCECPRGTVINEDTNVCVPVEECPKKANSELRECPVEGQVFTECGSACPANCTDPNPICTKPCVARCECPRGTVINEDTNTCVPVEECPKKELRECPVEGQVFTECGSACPANCTEPNPICTKPCVARCECPRGTVINEDTNTCVPVEECPKRKCPVQGQVFTECGSACPANCTIPNPICTKRCVARCECPRGTVINEDTNACVPVEECPKRIAVRSTKCPPGVPIVHCLVNPCQYAVCPAYPLATCVADYCGGCNARFYYQGVEVTDECDAPAW